MPTRRAPHHVFANTYAFVISVEMDANASIENSPLHFKFPTSETSVVSAPFVITPGASASAARRIKPN